MFSSANEISNKTSIGARLLLASCSSGIAPSLLLSSFESLNRCRYRSRCQSLLISRLVFPHNIVMKPVNDKQLIDTATKYNLDPNSMKSEAFALFDHGYSLKEVRFLLRRHKNPADPSSYSSTLRRYRILWESAQK